MNYPYLRYNNHSEAKKWVLTQFFFPNNWPMGVGCSHGVVEHTPDFRFHGASPLTLSKYGVRVKRFTNHTVYLLGLVYQ